MQLRLFNIGQLVQHDFHLYYQYKHDYNFSSRVT